MKEEKSYQSPTEEEKLIKERKKKKIIWTSITAGIVAIVTMILLLIFLIPRETKYEIELNSNITGVVLNGQGEYKDGEKVTIVAEEIEGYRFIGWSINGNIISTEKEYTFVIGEDTKGTYVANYEKLYEINIVNGKEENVTEQDYILGDEVRLIAEDIEGYRFIGWEYKEEIVSEEKEYTFKLTEDKIGTYTAKYQIIEYTVTLELSNGEIEGESEFNYTIESEDITLAKPTKEGYEFAGWTWEGQTEPQLIVTITKGSVGNRTYTANYTPVEYTVILELSNGEIEGESEFNYTIESEDITLARPTKEGYEFIGWTWEGQTEPQLTVTITKGSVGNRTYTANYTPVEYTVILELSDGEIEGESEFNYTIESEDITLAKPTKEGYEFIGWTWEGQTEPQKEVTIEKGTTGNKKYVANWEIKIYTITIQENEAYEIIKEDDKAEYGEEYKFKIVLKEAYTQSDILVKEEGQTIEIGEDGYYTIKRVTKDTTITIEGIKKNTYKITWQNYNGIELEVDDSVEHGTMPTYDGETPTKERDEQYEYIFDGWDSQITTATQDKVYIAQFRQEVRSYNILTEDIENGTIMVNSTAKIGDEVDVFVKPNDNYYISKIYYTAGDDTIRHSLKNIETDKYSFTMPAENVNIFVQIKTMILDDFVFENNVLTLYKGAEFEVDIPSVYSSKTINGENKLIRGATGENPTTVTAIGENAFFENTSNINVVSLKIPDTITSIGRNAFGYCFSLVEIINESNIDILSNGEEYGLMFREIEGIPAVHTNIQILENDYQSSIFRYENYLFKKYDNNTYTLIKYVGDNYEFDSNGLIIDDEGESIIDISLPTVLPSWCETNNYNIGAAAFSFNGKIRKVVVPENVTDMACLTFSYCLMLEEVDIKTNSIKEFGYGTFSVTALKEIEIPKSVTKLGVGAFESCNNLVSVTIPASIEEMKYSFRRCANLESIIFEEGSKLKEISSEEFLECKKLKSITIPSSIEIIGANAFDSCESLEEVIFEEESKLISINDLSFRKCSKLQTVVFDNEYLFTNSTDSWELFKNVLTIKVKDTITAMASDFIQTNYECIGNENGYNIYKKTFIISKDIPVGGEITCSLNKCLEGTEVEVTVTANDGYYLTNVYYVIDGQSDKNIITKNESGKYLFTMPQGNVKVYADFGQEITGFEFNGNTLVTYNGDSSIVNVPQSYSIVNIEGVNKIVEGEEILVSKIGDNAFEGNTTITNVILPKTITDIGQSAFSMCSSLEEINLPEDLKTIGEMAFAFTKINNLIIPKNVTEIVGICYACTNLENVSFAEESQLKTIGASSFIMCSKLTSIIIPSLVTEIGSGAFYSCTNLKEVVFSSSIEKIESEAFYASGIETLTFGNTSSLAIIGDEAFQDCLNLTTVVIPETVNSIGESAFAGCSNLINVSFEDNIQLLSLYQFVFSNCTSLEQIIIPESVKYINPNVFNGCSKLTYIYFENKTGWKVSEQEITEEQLTPANAALLLKETYLSEVWTRQEI